MSATAYIDPAELVTAILPRLARVKGLSAGGNIGAACPFHEDQHASFSLHTKTGLWRCHAAGCGEQGNAYQLGQRLGCLPSRPSRPSRSPSADWGLDQAMEKYGIRVTAKATVFTVYDHRGERCRDHARLHRGEPRFQYWGEGRVYHALLDWPMVRDWGKGCGIAYIVEGNRDWLTLAAHGWPAIGILGVEHFRLAVEEAFGHMKAAGIGALVLTPDNDQPGVNAVREWAPLLEAAGFVVGIRRLPERVDGRTVKDTFDLFQATGARFERWIDDLPVHWRV